MKLEVGQVVTINSAAGRYQTQVEEIRIAPAADHKLYEFYLCRNIDRVSCTGKRLPETAYFNENMANCLVEEVA